MGFYEDIRDTAVPILKEFGRSGKYISQPNGAWDNDFGTFVPGLEHSFEIQLMETKSQGPEGTQVWYEQIIEQASAFVIASIKGFVITPALGDHISYGEKTYVIIAFKAINPGGVVVAYRFALEAVAGDVVTQSVIKPISLTGRRLFVRTRIDLPYVLDSLRGFDPGGIEGGQAASYCVEASGGEFAKIKTDIAGKITVTPTQYPLPLRDPPIQTSGASAELGDLTVIASSYPNQPNSKSVTFDVRVDARPSLPKLITGKTLPTIKPLVGKAGFVDLALYLHDYYPTTTPDGLYWYVSSVVGRNAPSWFNAPNLLKLSWQSNSAVGDNFTVYLTPTAEFKPNRGFADVNVGYLRFRVTPVLSLTTPVIDYSKVPSYSISVGQEQEVDLAGIVTDNDMVRAAMRLVATSDGTQKINFVVAGARQLTTPKINREGKFTIVGVAPGQQSILVQLRKYGRPTNEGYNIPITVT